MVNINKSENKLPYVEGIPAHIYESMDVPTSLEAAKKKIQEINDQLYDMRVQAEIVDVDLEINPQLREELLTRKRAILSRTRLIFSQKRILSEWIKQRHKENVEESEAKCNKRIQALEQQFEEARLIFLKKDGLIAGLKEEVNSLRLQFHRERQTRHEMITSLEQKIRFLIRATWDIDNGNATEYIKSTLEFMQELVERNPRYGQIYPAKGDGKNCN